ncbi:hypothetical protein BV20DRAFT_721439 [Pilatotrama ljubarskyi]|nr:hypothetical protein BV20DRAFT_721439 [Pilatotrama ljubarskyi]
MRLKRSEGLPLPHSGDSIPEGLGPLTPRDTRFAAATRPCEDEVGRHLLPRARSSSSSNTSISTSRWAGTHPSPSRQPSPSPSPRPPERA